MLLQEFHIRMRAEVVSLATGRAESSAFLVWFLENFFRLELQSAVDSVCDQPNDKGIDGIFVDDEEEIIYLLQSKFSPNDDQHQGDNDLRNFIGARQWFNSEDSLNNLLNSTASRDLKSLIQSARVSEKLSYSVVSVFITNKIFNTHANEYLSVTKDLEYWDQNDLFNKYTYFADEENIFPKKELFVTNHTHIEYDLPDGTISRVYSIKAKELVKLDGIQDRTLFYKNVRYGVGKTRVNVSIKDTIQDQDQHSNFFLYHNGITIVSQELTEELAENKISLAGYAVVNGCQSMLTFFENQSKLSNNLFVLVKIIKLNLTSPMVRQITYFANNQNSISLKDLRSNDSVQKALQREFSEIFNNTILYKRKKGESEEGYATIIDKDFAAQLIEAFYIGKPQDTHLKQKLFGEDYTAIFSRKVTAEKIYLAYIIYDIINVNSALLENVQIRNYSLAIFFFSHVFAIILEEDELGRRVVENPLEFVTAKREILIRAITKLWSLITPDINYDFEEYKTKNDNFFDYKNAFKNRDFVVMMAGKIKSDYVRLTRRNIQDSFKEIFGQGEVEENLQS